MHSMECGTPIYDCLGTLAKSECFLWSLMHEKFGRSKRSLIDAIYPHHFKTLHLFHPNEVEQTIGILECMQ